MVKHVLYIYALSLLGPVSAQVLGNWKEFDVFVTKTLTSIHHLCSCPQSTVKASDATRSWAVWNEDPAAVVATTNLSKHAGTAEWHTTTAMVNIINPTLINTSSTKDTPSSITKTNPSPTSTLSFTTFESDSINLSTTILGVTIQTIATTFLDRISSVATTSDVTSSTVNPTLTGTSLTLDTTSTTSGVTLSSLPPSSSWIPRGCYDNIDARMLSYAVLDSPTMSVELCLQTCAEEGFSIAGLQASQECWCYNSFETEGGPAVDGDARCNLPCAGDSFETCGGFNWLDIYTFGAAT